MECLITHLSGLPYDRVWKMQTDWLDEIIQAKLTQQPYTNRIVLCHHDPTFTIGKSGKEKNMLLSEERLRQMGVSLYHVDRGGDITYHGPGQIVCYPILNLEEFGLSLRQYIQMLEEAVIRVCAGYGIEAGRIDKATGVWLEADTARARKICAIGVRCSHFVTMHGLAFNVNTDLNYFRHINPCGFVDKGVTSLQQELGHEVPIEEVEERLCQQLFHFLGR